MTLIYKNPAMGVTDKETLKAVIESFNKESKYVKLDYTGVEFEITTSCSDWEFVNLDKAKHRWKIYKDCVSEIEEAIDISEMGKRYGKYKTSAEYDQDKVYAKCCICDLDLVKSQNNLLEKGKWYCEDCVKVGAEIDRVG